MRKLLIATGAVVVNSADLPAGVRYSSTPPRQILIVTQSLPTRIDWITSGTDRASLQADQRL